MLVPVYNQIDYRQLKKKMGADGLFFLPILKLQYTTSIVSMRLEPSFPCLCTGGFDSTSNMLQVLEHIYRIKKKLGKVTAALRSVDNNHH